MDLRPSTSRTDREHKIYRNSMCMYFEGMERVLDIIGETLYVKDALQNMEIVMNMQSSFNRYMWVLAPAMVVYLISTFGISWAEKNLGFSTVVLYGLSLVPILAFLVAMWAHWRHTNELDEYLFKVQMNGMMFGLAMVLSVSTTWGMLEGLANAPRLNLMFVILIFSVGYSGAVMFLTFQNRKKSHEE